MSDSMRAIYDDIRDYERRCEKYGKKIQYSHGNPACYGEHANYVEALEVRDLIRSGQWHECNWTKRFQENFSISDLDVELNRMDRKLPGSCQSAAEIPPIEEELTRFHLLEVD